MESLPSYQDINRATAPDSAHTSSPVIGGSGARIPLARETRAQVQTFHADPFYRTATNQLDIILPALSSSTLPPTTALRTITLRIRLPPPDVDFVNEIKQSGLTQGRGVIKKGLKGWFQRVNNDKGEEAVFEAVDSIAGRIAIEGVFSSGGVVGFEKGVVYVHYSLLKPADG
ncbi:hypothetical protein FRC09_021008 [Ceratobasidium sp. 395]|nr:hypothetical protein FRC09_021008 [Ceratobasidium sp. 395]